MKKKFPEVKTAFTLAETLLTLAIVGVIAALTIPTLKDYSDEVRYITGVQKAFATINAATTAIETKHGDAMFWKFDQDKTINWYRETMNVIPTTNDQTWERTHIDGTEGYTFKPSFFTADGMAWSIGTGGYPCGGGCALVDINGPQPPNVIGIDQHGFRLGTLCNQNTKLGDWGVYPMGDILHDENASWACTAYVIKHNKMPWIKGMQNIKTCQDVLELSKSADNPQD